MESILSVFNKKIQRIQCHERIEMECMSNQLTVIMSGMLFEI